MIHLDLGYARPYSPVWDPVLIAARKVGRLRLTPARPAVSRYLAFPEGAA